MTAKVILNPYAARWKALKRRGEAEAALRVAGIDFHLEVSKAPGHNLELAAEAVKLGYNPVIAAGGDSTFNEVVNGILQATGEGPAQTNFGILPMGTANDLADNLGYPLDLKEAAQIIAAGHTKPLDICQANERYFVNNSAVGMETNVSVIQSNMKYVHGVFRYLLATLIGIAQNPQWVMDLTWDDGEYHGPVTLVSVGNNPRTGGIFYTVPHADPFDGKLSFVYGSVPTRREILRVLPSLTKSGEDNYVNHPAVHEVHSTWLKIHTEPATALHTDGEIIERTIQNIEYRVHPGRLPMLLQP
jgi:diacylglycerol kinase (ATP)